MVFTPIAPILIITFLVSEFLLKRIAPRHTTSDTSKIFDKKLEDTILNNFFVFKE